MGDAFETFAFAFSVLNFLILAFLFNKVVVLPMVEAVQLRGEKVSLRLEEIGKILAEARKTEAHYQEQFTRLATEEKELRDTNAREIERVTTRIKTQAEADAQHLVAKAKREAEKTRVEALAQLQHEVVVQALSKVEGELRKNLDEAGHSDANSQFLSKVGGLRA
jgi:F-type H+-transporting ATPase subunit b